MRALVLPAPGATPAVARVAEPTAGAGRALVRVAAAGLNPVDQAIAAGRFYLPLPDPPFVLGAELVGTVVTGERWTPGTRVWALVTTGGFADLAAVDEELLVPVPDGVDDAAACALGIAGLAGWMSVRDRAALAPGETVVVLGASGVVGRVAVQAARLGGAARVVAVSRRAAWAPEAAGLGADAHVALDDHPDLGSALRAACPSGADVVVDMLWGEPVLGALAAAAPRARVVQVGNAAGPVAQIPGGALRGGRIDLRGFSVFAERTADLARAYGVLGAAAVGGEVRVQTGTMALADAGAAWERQAAGTGGVKLVLVP